MYFWMRSPWDGHDRCCSLGHAHAGVDFVDGTCRSVAMGTLQSQLSCFSEQKVTSVAPHPGPFATMHKALAASAEGEGNWQCPGYHKHRAWVDCSCPEQLRKDDWFLGSERHTQLCSVPVPFLPEFTKNNLMRSSQSHGRYLFTAKALFAGSFALTTLNGESSWDYSDVPSLSMWCEFCEHVNSVPTRCHHLEEQCNMAVRPQMGFLTGDIVNEFGSRSHNSHTLSAGSISIMESSLHLAAVREMRGRKKQLPQP